MKTLNTKLSQRLALQAKEARVQGLVKVAENVNYQLSQHTVRTNDLGYRYNYQDLQKDAQAQIWGAIVRIADYYGTSFDAVEAQKLAEAAVEDLVKELCARAGIKHGVGCYEDTLPGEEIVVFE